MNRQQRRSEKNNTSPQPRKDWNTVTMKSENLEAKSQNLEHIPTPNLHTQATSTQTSPDTITNTKLKLTQTAPLSQVNNMNPAGMQTALPPPSIHGLDDSEEVKPQPQEKKPVKSAPAPVTKVDKLTQELTQLYATIGLFVTRADAYDGILLIKESEKRAIEMVNVAKHHKGMMKVLERLVESNDYVSMALGHGMMVYAILAHHNRIKADPVFLAQLGYHEQQVLAAPPQGHDGSNFAEQANGLQPVTV